MPVTGAIALVGGALAGSAAGSALHRWPQGDTLLRPVRSCCGACRTVLTARDLVPVVSWLLLRGRCRTCGNPIDGRLPALEAACALAVAAIVRTHGANVIGLLLAAGAIVVLLASLTDLEGMRIPDRLTLPSAAIVPVLVLLAGRGTVGLVAIGWSLGLPAALAAFSALCVRAGLPRPIGGGDLKLLVSVLALAALVTNGPARVLSIALLSAGAVAGAGLVTGMLERGARIPFAPAIAAGYLGGILVPSSAITLARWSSPWSAVAA
jgi:leader peptidase (prepilin peptidase)/N-methyltransferase